jgi:hypothetical protein
MCKSEGQNAREVASIESSGFSGWGLPLLFKRNVANGRESTKYCIVVELAIHEHFAWYATQKIENCMIEIRRNDASVTHDPIRNLSQAPTHSVPE